MRTLPMLVAGATFTGLLLVLPAIYWANWSGQPLPALTWSLIALPFALLAASLARPHPGVTHFGFLAAHLPALLVEPGLTGSEVYSGSRGLAAVAVLGALGLAWLWACGWAADGPAPQSDDTDSQEDDSAGAEATSSRTTAPRPAAGLSFIAGAMGLAVYSAFASAAIGHADTVEPLPASVTLLVGLIVAWYVSAIEFVNRVGDTALDVRARRRVLASLFVERRRTKADIWTTIIWLLVALLGALLWYL